MVQQQNDRLVEVRLTLTELQGPAGAGEKWHSFNVQLCSAGSNGNLELLRSV